MRTTLCRWRTVSRLTSAAAGACGAPAPRLAAGTVAARNEKERRLPAHAARIEELAHRGRAEAAAALERVGERAAEQPNDQHKAVRVHAAFPTFLQPSGTFFVAVAQIGSSASNESMVEFTQIPVAVKGNPSMFSEALEITIDILKEIF